MVSETRLSNLDWYKDKSSSASIRAKSDIIQYYASGADNVKMQPKAKCVWPSSFLESNSKFISRRVKAKVL